MCRLVQLSISHSNLLRHDTQKVPINTGSLGCMSYVLLGTFFSVSLAQHKRIHEGSRSLLPFYGWCSTFRDIHAVNLLLSKELPFWPTSSGRLNDHSTASEKQQLSDQHQPALTPGTHPGNVSERVYRPKIQRS